MNARHFFLTLTGGLLALGLGGCTAKTDMPAPAASSSAPAKPSAAALPAVTITTVRAQQRDLPVLYSATGTVMALASVDIKSQVTSVVSKIHIQDGQFVKAGELLFTLDSRTDEANLAKARAQLAKDNALRADAQRQLTRAQQLYSQNFISQGAVDTAQAQLDSMAASVVADQAAIEAARVAVSYAHISAPNAGRAGAVNLSQGSVVQANLTSLVTITQLDPIAVSFNLPQRTLADTLSALKNGGAAVKATIADGGASFMGHLNFVDNTIDPSSGSVKVKAVFANPQGKLWPGAFVDISQTVNTLKDAVVIPQAAIIPNARGTMVYVVEAGKAVLRPVQVVLAQGDDAAVTGVKAGESIVLDGKQNLRPNAPVLEQARAPAGGASGPAGGAASKAASGAAASQQRSTAS
ncbi:MAG TPA: efflux RND transporter periplasmic adaptor subunit [Rhodoferax sp.]